MTELTENILRLQYESFKKYVNCTEKELETLRAKLVKAEKVIAVASKGPCRHAHDKNSCELCEALKEYRGEP